MKKVVINQSNYIPWKGYFDLIHDADVFIFYDDVQFTVRDWRNRNRIKTPQGLIWLTIPAGADRDRKICDIKIDQHEWQRKHWETIRRCYCRAPFFEKYEELFRPIYLDQKWNNLSELNQSLIKLVAQDCLGIKTTFLQSSSFKEEGKGQDRILNLLKAVGTDVYVSGPAGKDYLEHDRFQRENIELIWKDYSGYPEYSQFHLPFEHAVTVLDLLFHVGPEAPSYIWGWRGKRHQPVAVSRRGLSHG